MMGYNLLIIASITKISIFLQWQLHVLNLIAIAFAFGTQKSEDSHLVGFL